MRKLFVSTILFLLIILIYSLFQDNRIYYLSLGSSLAVGKNAYEEYNYGYSDYVGNYLTKNKLLKFYTKDFSKEEYTSKQLTDIIKNDVLIDINGSFLSLKRALRKTNLITLSIDMEEVLYKESKDEINKILQNQNDLIKEIKKYTNGNILLLNYYSVNKETDLNVLYANEGLKNMAIKNKICYLDIYDLFKNPSYLPNYPSIYPGNKGYEAIGNEIIDKIEDILANKTC